MTVTEAERTRRPSADHIRRRAFARVRRGFDPDQVREYLERVAGEVERLEEEVRRARAESDSLARGTRSARADAYGELATRIADLLRTADLHAQATRREAQEEAERQLLQARDESETIKAVAEAEAQATRREADDVLRRAREEADRMLAGLAGRRDDILGDLQGMRERLMGVVHRLESAMTGEEPPAPPIVEEDATVFDWDEPSTETIDLSLPDIPSLEPEDEVGSPGGSSEPDPRDETVPATETDNQAERAP